MTYIEKFAGTENIRVQSKAYLKINYGYSYSALEYLNTVKSLNLNVRLAKIEKKLNIFLSSFRERETEQKELNPYYNPQNIQNNKFSLGLEYVPVLKYLNINFRAAITTANKSYLKATIDTPKIILGGFSIEIMEVIRRDMYFIKNKPITQDYTQIYMNKLLSKDLILSFFLERRKLTDKPFNSYIISSSLSKVYGKNKKLLVTFNISQTGNKIIGSYPVNYNAGISNRYQFYKWAYFNFNFGVKWQREFDFHNNPYVLLALEIYFGKW